MTFVSNEEANTYENMQPGTVLFQPVSRFTSTIGTLRSIDAYTDKEEALKHWWFRSPSSDCESVWVEETTIEAFLEEKLRNPGCTLSGIMAPSHIREWFTKNGVD